MAPLVINGTEDTPEVIFEPSTGKFSITGTSIPENARKFYDQIIAWIDEYVKEPNADTSISFKLKYFNTASTKYLFDIMVQLKPLVASKHNLVYNWFFLEDDEDMYEAGQGFSKMLRYPFNFVKY
ncbi:MAG: DUF1987 domain-containing protein, partial [Paludibacteraceae bacterium]|nr:DUF1987 domain-containing protein [Paludibacteraceae bacterium]